MENQEVFDLAEYGISHEDIKTAEKNGVSSGALLKRIENGMPVDEAVKIPMGGKAYIEWLESGKMGWIEYQLRTIFRGWGD